MSPEELSFDARLVTKQAVQAAADGDLDAIFRDVVNKSLAGIPSADGALVEMREDDELVLRAGSGDAAKQVGQRKRLDRSFAGRSMQIGRAMICDDIEAETDVDLDGYRDAGMRSLLSVPIVHHQKSLGALKFFAKRPYAFEPKDLTIAQLVGAQIVSGLVTVSEQPAVKARLESEARFRAIMEALPQMIWTMSQGGKIEYCNQWTLQFLGISQPLSQLQELFSFVLPADRAAVQQAWKGTERLPRHVTMECRVQPMSGEHKWVQLHLIPVDDSAGELIEWLGAGIDIDALKQMALELEDSVRAQSLLLEEINHRVKNSLQLVMGLLTLQAGKIEDAEGHRRMLEVRDQVATVAQAYHSRYRSAEHNQFQFSALLESMVTALAGAAQHAMVDFQLPESIDLPLDLGIPLSMVAGEIVANALRYGAGPDDTCQLTVRLMKEESNLVLEIYDNGPGLPPAVLERRSSGLGMELIYGLMQQAKGKVEIMPSKRGVHFRLTLAVP